MTPRIDDFCVGHGEPEQSDEHEIVRVFVDEKRCTGPVFLSSSDVLIAKACPAATLQILGNFRKTLVTARAPAQSANHFRQVA